ncbi:MAG: nuclear transport factor 2 family protein [Alphaproteobacteria bacterium]
MSIANDHFAIEQLCRRFMWAIDHADIAAFKDIFTPTARWKGLDLDFSVAEFAAFAEEMKEDVPITLHYLANTIAEIDGASATVKSNFYAVHAIPANRDTALGRHEQDMDAIMAGQYYDKMIKADGQWKIDLRETVITWQSWRPTAGRPF